MRLFLTLMILGIILGLPGFAAPARAQESGNWTLVPAESQLTYGTIKAETIGETNHFKTLSGTVTPAGQAEITIDLTTVQTGVETRDERMRRYIFGEDHKTATLTAQLDIAALTALAPGETATIDVTGALDFLGHTLPIEAPFFIARLTPDRVLVMTDNMIMMSTADLGIDEGIDELMALAHLPSITRVTPVTLHAVFER